MGFTRLRDVAKNKAARAQHIAARNSVESADFDTRRTTAPSPSPSKHTTTRLAYPEGVGQDPDQGHWILFEVLAQNKGQLKNAKIREAKVQANLDRTRGAKLFTAAADGGFTPSREQTPAPELQIIDNRTEGLVNSSVAISKQSTTRLDTVIALYMPPSVQAKYDVKYADQEIGVVAESGFAALKAFQGSQGGMSGLWEAGKTAAEGAGAGLARWGMSKAAAEVQGLDAVIAIERGQVITPRMELMFEGMGRRSFNYSFTFIPKSEDEAITVEEIVKHFKIHMMPNFTSTTVPGSDAVGGIHTGGVHGVREMTIPDHFNIVYMHKNSINTHLNKIHTCALTSMDVDYGAERFTGYAGGRPQTTKIALNFTEFNIMSKDHIRRGY